MRSSPVITALMTVAILVFLACPALPREEVEQDVSLSATGDARVAVAIDGTGMLREAADGRARLGLRWPGPGGTEFLGSCQFVMRYRLDGRDMPTVLMQQAFEPGLPGSGVVRLGEGCAGGRRGPGPAGDDDGDGAVDEDPYDGIDNDGDGAVDEDFGATGQEMLVTRARSSRGGLYLTQDCYHWDFGHVRDFLGFTTTIAYAPPRPQDRPLRLFEAALVSDFRIGDADDDQRGGDDRFRHVAMAETEDGTPRYAVSFARDPRGPAAAVVIFSATGPGGTHLPVEVSILPSSTASDSLWEKGARKEAAQVLTADGAGAWMGVDAEPLRSGRFATTPLTGEQAFVHRFGGGVDLRPGETIVIEWAIVFGRDLPSVMRAAERARETWRGTYIAGDSESKWIVPARTARRIETEASLSPAWVLGERRAAAGLLVPPGLDEDVEWLAVDGAGADAWELVGGRIVTIVDGALVAAGAPFSVEAQLTDGTILTGRIDIEEIARFEGSEQVAPGRLPDECLRLFPNPFVGSLTIDLVIEDTSMMPGKSAVHGGAGSVRIFDVKGRLVRSILEEELLGPGEVSLSWDGTDETGAPVAPGVYYCKFQVGERSLTKRVILLR